MCAASDGRSFRGESVEAALAATVSRPGAVEVNPGMASGAAQGGTK